MLCENRAPAKAPVVVRPSWTELVRKEPRLGALKVRARVIGRQVRRSGNPWPEWSAGVKALLLTLVGWERPGAYDPVLSGSPAYETALRELLKAFEQG